MDIVVIGCGTGGATAAQFARKHDRNATITVFEKGSYPQYSKCALPWVLSGELTPEAVIELSKDWFDKNNINLHLKTAVEHVDLDDKSVVANNGKYGYDVLIVATGASPFSPVKPKGRTFFLRTLEDVKAINRASKISTSALIIGGGMIGLETADALHRRGMDITVIEYLAKPLLATIDSDISIEVCKRISGIKMHFNHKITKIDDQDDVIVTAIDEQSRNVTYSADMVVVATGNRPNIDLVPNLARQAIVVNEQCQTMNNSVYAIGDCTQYNDIVGNAIVSGLGSIAVRQAMVAGENAVGGNAAMPPIVAARTTEIFGVEIAGVGPTSMQLPFSPVSGKVIGKTRPKYMPSETVLVKVLADINGTIIGAQAVGPAAAQRINKFAVAVQTGMSLASFIEIETAYAPTVAPMIDASTMACEIAKRRLR